MVKIVCIVCGDEDEIDMDIFEEEGANCELCGAEMFMEEESE